MLIPIAWKTETLMSLIVMLYWFQLNAQKVQKSIDAQTKVELKIPQLTLWKIAQMGRHETVNTKIEVYSHRAEGSIPVRGNFCA